MQMSWVKVKGQGHLWDQLDPFYSHPFQFLVHT